MNTAKPHSPLQLPPYTERVYKRVLGWLDGQEDASDFRTHHPDLNADEMRDVAAQYYMLFATHYFKVTYTLNNVIDQQRFASIVRDNPHICFVDIGCGAGCASVAFVESLLHLREQGTIDQPPDILCIGVDPALRALALYDRVMKELENEVSPIGVSLAHRTVAESVPGATTTLESRLKSVREQRQMPNLAHVVIAQVNIVRPFLSGLKERQDIQQELEDLGISRTCFLTEQEDSYGFQEVLTYLELMERVPIDHVHIVTIATSENPEWRTLVQRMQLAIDTVFGKGNETERIAEGDHTVSFINPTGNFYRDRYGRQDAPPVTFHVDVSSITRADWQKDGKWLAVADPENLRLAWARVRASLIRESLLDETEIRPSPGFVDKELSASHAADGRCAHRPPG